jgi:hypothetical protein
MKRKGVAGLPAVHRITPAANEDFAGLAEAMEEGLGRPHAGWDPYEVWRTRVKVSPTVKQEREREPLR